MIVGPHWTDTSEHVPVDLSLLLGGVYVAPTSPPWFLEVVASVTRQYGQSVAVHHSQMDRAPFI
jgi:hypothetical protein